MGEPITKTCAAFRRSRVISSLFRAHYEGMVKKKRFLVEGRGEGGLVYLKTDFVKRFVFLDDLFESGVGVTIFFFGYVEENLE